MKNLKIKYLQKLLKPKENECKGKSDGFKKKKKVTSRNTSAKKLIFK